MRFLWFFATLFIISTAQADLFKSETTVLDNGLEVVILENHRAPIVTHMVWYKVGSIDDPLGKSGIAHVLEHLMFKGTKKIPDGAFSKIIAKNGGNENAMTSFDFTAYYQNIAKDRLELVMFLEADRMRNLLLTQKDFEPELQVVQEERLLRYDNNPARLLSERKGKALWNDHPYGRPIIGIKKELADLQLKDIESFYKTYYAPDNAVLVISGDVTLSEIKPLIEKYYGVLPPRRTALEKRQFTQPYPVSTQISMQHPQIKIRTLSKEYITPSFLSDDKKAYALAVLAEILGAQSVGFLSKTLVTKAKIASHVGANYNGYALDKGSFSIYAVAQDPTTLEKLQHALDALLKPDRITQKDLDKAKIRLVAGMEYINDDPNSIANIVGNLRVLGVPLDKIQTYKKHINAVTLADVRTVLATLLLSQTPKITTKLEPEDKTK